MHSDIVVTLRGGTYELAQPFALGPADSGSNGYYVTYAAAAGEVPILSGGRRIVHWKRFDERTNVWVTQMADPPRTRQLFVGGVRANRARSADGVTGFTLLGTKGYTLADTAMSAWRNPSDIEFVYRVKWTEQRCDVEDISGNRISMKQPCFANSADLNRRINNGTNIAGPTYIENAFELLDEAGEWYLDRPAGHLYYIPRPGEDLSSAVVVMPVLEGLLVGRGSPSNPIHHLKFIGLTFAFSTWLGPSGGAGFSEAQANVALVDVDKTLGRIPASVAFSGARAIRFERNSFVHLGAGGLALDRGSQDNIVVGNVFADISGNGLQLGEHDVLMPAPNDRTTGNSIISNYFHDLPAEYHGGVGIWVGYSSGTTIAHNELERLSYSAISNGWGWGAASYSSNNKITNNLIHDHMQLLTDGGGIYSNGIQGTSFGDGELIEGNVVHDQAHPYGAIYLDNGSQYVTVTRNLTYAVPHHVFQNGNLVPNAIKSDNFTDPAAAPPDIVASAGLYPAYRDIK
jgi:hypothetical protein